MLYEVITEYKVNILTELAFQVSKDLLGSNYDQVELNKRLDDIATHVLIDKLYPDSDVPLGREDIVYWLPNANKNWLIKDYTNDLHPIIEKVHQGAYIMDDAYEYIYGEIPNALNPILATTWYYVDENIKGKRYLGNMTVKAHGVSLIKSFQLSGDGAEKFSINQDGEIFLETDVSLNFEKKSYYVV